MGTVGARPGSPGACACGSLDGGVPGTRFKKRAGGQVKQREVRMASMPKRAMVLAAGKGLRMRPITDKTPKPMIPINGRPLIDHVLERLADAGITETVVNTHHLAIQIERYLAGRDRPKVIFSNEEVILETGGGVKNALLQLGEKPFFAVNSDAFWLNGPTDALQRLADIWDEDKMDGLLLLHSTVDAYGYTGRGDFDPDLTVTGPVMAAKPTRTTGDGGDASPTPAPAPPSPVVPSDLSAAARRKRVATLGAGSGTAAQRKFFG